VGRGTLLGVPRPKYGVEYERGDADVFGTVLCALVAGRLTLPIGGRGTDRDAGEGEEVTPPNLAAEGSDIDLTPFCGRGMFWFIAVCGPGLSFRPAMVELFTP
jgi:hypothetical protein